MFRRFTPRIVRLEDRSTPAAVGSLDPSFNDSGLADVAFDLGGINADAATAVAVQFDGKIVVVGSAQLTGTDVDFAVVRFNPDGTLDTTFGSKGKVAIGFDLGGGDEDRATGVAIQTDGRIVVAGYASEATAGDYDYAVLRLNTDGSLDTTFDGDGRATVSFDLGGANVDKASAVAIDSSNRIVLAGTVQVGPLDTDFGVARLTLAGALDTTFDADGREEIAFDLGGANADRATSVATLADDRVVVAGTAEAGAGGDFDFAVARFTAAGIPDSTFDTDGRTTFAFDRGSTNEDVATGVAIDVNGRIVLAGTVAEAIAGDFDFGIVRLNTDGKLDTSFNATGSLATHFDLGSANADRAAGVDLDPAGRIVVAGTVDQPTAGDTDLGIMRLNPDGTLDVSFDGDGRSIVAADLGGANADRAAGVAILPNGRIVAVGTSDSGVAGDTDLVVARLIGATEQSDVLAVGGIRNGTARLFTATGTAFADSGTATPFPPSIGVVRTAVADVNGDGFADSIYGVGPGGGSGIRIHISIDPALAPVALPPPPIAFDAFEPTFIGGVFVAAADIDGDGRAEVIVSPDVGGGGRVQIFSITGAVVTLVDNFFGIADPSFRGGARVAAGDLSGDGRADLVVGAGFGGGPRIAVFDGADLLVSSPAPARLIGDFFAFPGADATRLRNGVFVAVGDITGDGQAEMVFGGGPGGGPRVYVLDGAQVLTDGADAAQADPVANFFVAGNTAARGGIRLAVKDLDADNLADLITGSGDVQPSRVRVYPGSGFPQLNGLEPPAAQEFDPFGDTLATGVFVG